MIANNSQVGFDTTVTVETPDGKELSLKLGDEVLAEILEHEVTIMDENAIAEELLFVKNIAVTYDVNTNVVLHTDKKKPKSD